MTRTSLLAVMAFTLIGTSPALAESGGDNPFMKRYEQKRLERAEDKDKKKKAKKEAKKAAKRAKPQQVAIIEEPPPKAPEPDEPIFTRKVSPPPPRAIAPAVRKDPNATPVSLPKGASATATEVVADQGVKPIVSTQSSSWLENAISRYQAIAANGGWPKVEGRLKKGADGEDVARLKRRLHAEGYLNDAAVSPEKIDQFTGGTEKAVKLFQSNYGLAQTGWIDKPTQAALNVSVNQRLATMRANTGRLDAYTKDLGDRYIVVNIPALQLEAVGGGQVFSKHNVIVGKPDRPSPVVMTSLKDLNFNPYWNVPASIVERDLIPRILKEGVQSLAVQNIKVFDGFGGPEIDPSEVDWANTPGDRYFMRQEPGADNAMAAVKINFPSPFGVYMHDTPLRNLFGSAGRYLSSGCVRVDKVHILVDWILNGQDGWDPNRIEQMAQTGERLDVELAAPPQLRWVYLTSWADERGFVHFRDDIYDLDGSGFTVGQPLPVGELTADGQRYMLKLPPAQAKAAAEGDFDAVSAPRSKRVKPEAALTPVKKPAAKTAKIVPAKAEKTLPVTETAAKTAAKKPVAAAAAVKRKKPVKKPAAGATIDGPIFGSN